MERTIGRKKRIWYPGATYHVMERGVQRQKIFNDDMDYNTFMAILQKAIQVNNAHIHAYCLMSNHVHLLIETGDEDIGKVVNAVAGNYAKTYNKKYGLRGHLFEDRYKACIVESDEYFLQTSRYIHLNPVKAKMVCHAEDYKWSSYRTIINMKDDGITTTAKTLGYFKVKGEIGYRDFVEDIAHKYIVSENEIKKMMGEDELWLPW